MPKFDYDLFVVGAGSGGVRAARTSAAYGARVAIAEDRFLGGTCVNAGCIPKKLFFYAAHFADDFNTAEGYGWNIDKPGFNWQTLINNKNNEIERLNRVYQKILDDAGVITIRGRATLSGPHSVRINDEVLSAEKILIATGGWPDIPEVAGREYAISSNEAFHLKALPEKIIVVGGGYIAVEFAGIFHGLGVDTSLLYRGPLFLRGFDPELREFLAAEMKRHGVNVQFNANIANIQKNRQALTATLEDGTTMEAGRIMYATGRKPNTAGLGLEDAGVALDDNGAIKVDRNYRTNIASVYAIGDVTNRINLTPVALAEGMILANALFNNGRDTVDYSNVPTCIFSQPNLASVGLTEEQARAQQLDIAVYKSIFTPMKSSLSNHGEKVFIKLIVAKDGDRVIGAHMIGPEAGEIIQGISIAIKAGATKAAFDATIGVHPTIAEEFVSLRQAVDDE